jgi:hypothetical protein
MKRGHRQRIADAAIAIAGCSIILGAREALALHATLSSGDVVRVVGAACFGLGIIALTLSLAVGVCATAWTGAWRRVHDEPNETGARLLTVVAGLGVLALTTHGAAWLVQAAFASSLVRRLGLGLSVGGTAVLLLLNYGRAVRAFGRLLTNRRPSSMLIGALVVWVGPCLWLSRGALASLDPTLLAAPAILLVVACWAAVGLPVTRAKQRSPRLARGVAIAGLACWVASASLTAWFVASEPSPELTDSLARPTTMTTRLLSALRAGR